LSLDSNVQEIFFAPTGPLVATTSLQPSAVGSMYCLQLWDGRTGNRGAMLYRDPRPITNVEFSTDGKQISATVLQPKDARNYKESSGGPPPERISKCWDVESGTEVTRAESFSPFHPVAEFPQHGPRRAKERRGYHGVRDPRFPDWSYAPSVNKLAWIESEAPSDEVWVWDASTNTSRLLFRAAMGISNLSLSPDGRQLAAWRAPGSARGSARIWRPLYDALFWIGIHAPIRWDSETCIFDARDGTELACLPRISDPFKFSPDGTSFALILGRGGVGDVLIYDAPFHKPRGRRAVLAFTVAAFVFLFLTLTRPSTIRAVRRFLSHHNSGS
jgi:WD40 repeat protein